MPNSVLYANKIYNNNRKTLGSCLIECFIHFKLADGLWFKSYLQQRRQTVYVNGAFSDVQVIELGVPQGSVLGPILF